MMFNSRVTRTKPVHILCVIVIGTGIFGLISNELMFSEKVVEERPPNRTFYYSLLFRDVKSLNFTSPTIHNESEIIVIVCTKPGDISIRNVIRQTWASPLFSEAVHNKSVSVVFLIGTGYISLSVREEMRKHNDILQVDVPDSYGNLVYKNKSVSVVFLIGTGYISLSVREEMRKHNDILQVDVPDSYGNLVYKSQICIQTEKMSKREQQANG
ncbi:hypothetical protein TELCIR_10609 [Teladorsagia circumcincta]|uniref:Hexosyltransferase n=1 Tax=Teladorsagia circumcincta TaxID=45464 RepID=A0A2G9UDS4_TELCI|nr:hypothetical protein TELCIR_10609 [Teladorsagia circumcincta]